MSQQEVGVGQTCVVVIFSGIKTSCCLQSKTITLSLLYRYTSSVHYDSDRHFIQALALQPTGRGLEHCRQTIMAVPHSTWRHYKTQLEFQPRHRPQHFKSTTIVYPKKTSALYTTELSYNCNRLSKRFLSSVELVAESSLSDGTGGWEHKGAMPKALIL